MTIQAKRSKSPCENENPTDLRLFCNTQDQKTIKQHLLEFFRENAGNNLTLKKSIIFQGNGIYFQICSLAPDISERNESESHSVVPDSLPPHGLYSPWNSPGQNTGVGSLSLLQGIFPTQGSNPGLPHCRWILYQLSYQVSPLTILSLIKKSQKTKTHKNTNKKEVKMRAQ